MDPEDLLGKAEEAIQEMERLEGKMEEAETEQEKQKLQQQLEAKDQEVQDLTDRLERAKDRQGKKQQIKNLRGELSTDDAGKTMAPEGGDGDPEGDKAPAKAKDRQKEQRAAEIAFGKYLQGKELTGQEHQALEPQSPNWDNATDGKKVPDHLLPAIMGDRWGKAMQLGKTLLSSDAGDASLVDDDYRRELLELPPEPGHMLGRVTIIPTDTGTVTIPRLVQSDNDEYGGVSFSWIDEGGSKPETEPKFEQVQVDCHECSGYTEMSKTMISRSEIGLIALLRRLYRQAAQAEIDDMIYGGDGVGEPLGIINTAGIRTVGRTAAGDVQYADLVALKHLILAHHRSDCAFSIDDTVEEDLELATDADGRPFFCSSTASGPYDRLVNYPYEVTERQPDIGSDGDVIYGDFSWYFLAQEQEMVIETSRHYKFRKNLQAFTLYMLIGGRLVEPRAAAVLVGSSS